MIEEQLLIQYGGSYKKYKKQQVIFCEGSAAFWYYQILKGTVHMLCVNDAGDKEFMQGTFFKGDSFGEPPLFDDQPYPASAIAATGCDVIALRKEAFFSLLRSNPDMHLKFSKMIAERLRYKSVMLKEITCFPAAHRILTLLKFYKNTNEKKENEFIKITQTRKQIALQTGLRVETVIRIIKQMETDHILTIKDGKIFI